ncbi:DUF4145 domain-containing protein [Marinomonas aquiplantarum]|uniref:Uncharacterized protein DUF4145 n=1 Tax=Marinomonas aquiplantarum TaxID=491951 RepID=A0A366CYC5_9GAMM|nr:DUF4145 domain-containing protein [Marinomonas aquiplantarum]RBO82666.1 uncharacterized protein DUF4145 [Marinomonas aquiplantarum]
MLNKLSNRFDELFKEVPLLESTIVPVDGGYYKMDEAALLVWEVKVKSLLISSCGKESIHYSEFLEAKKTHQYESTSDVFKRLQSVFIAAMDDYKGGFLTSIKNLIQADVFDSELEQANELLNSGYKLASAVIAGVVLETALRDLCVRESILTGKLDKMNADLTKKGVYNKLQQKRITALADIRNSAAHGKPNDFSENDVKNMIKDIEQFLAVQLA